MKKISYNLTCDMTETSDSLAYETSYRNWNNLRQWA